MKNKATNRRSGLFRRLIGAGNRHFEPGAKLDESQSEPAPRSLPVLAKPRRAALLVRGANDAVPAVKRLGALEGVFSPPPPERRIFVLDGGMIGLADRETLFSSFLHTDAPGLFDVVFVDPNVRLFDTAYGKAFVLRAASMVAPGGRLILPDWSPCHPKYGITPARLSEFLGSVGVRAMADSMMCFAEPFLLDAGPSVLRWYLRYGPALILQEELLNAVEPPSDWLAEDTIGTELLANEKFEPLEPLEPKTRPTIDDLAQSHAYLISGLSYKAALVAYILDEMLRGRTGLRYADIGGGFGALAAELLMTAPVERFTRAVTRDIAWQNIMLARNLYMGNLPCLANRFQFSLGPAETFRFEDGYDVVSFVGSLLYVDKARVAEVLERAWSALRPGGLMIVHENIKNAAYVRDFAVMFETHELNELLGRFGEIRCFMSTACAEIDCGTADKRTLFRVLQAPGYSEPTINSL